MPAKSKERVPRGRSKSPGRAKAAGSSSMIETSSRSPRSASRGRGRGGGRMSSPGRTTGRTSSPARASSPSRRGRSRKTSAERGAATKRATEQPSPATSTVLRSRKKEVFPNGTGSLSVSVNEVVSRARRSKLSPTPRPKMTTSIFDNIALTPSKIVGEKRTPTPSASPKHREIVLKPRVKKWTAKVMASTKQMARQCQKHLSKYWKIWLAGLLLAVVISICIYVWIYHSEAVKDYIYMIKERVTKNIKKISSRAAVPEEEKTGL